MAITTSEGATARRRTLRRTVEAKLRRHFRHLLDSEKKALIDRAFEEVRAGSIADLGGVWRVDAGYTFYTLDRHRPERAFLVDTTITNAVQRKAARHANLVLVEATFDDPRVRERIGQVDVVTLFDVLLHQARPTWKEILAAYADLTRSFAIFNPQWTGSEDTVRMLDLTRDVCLWNVPVTEQHSYAYDHQDERHPEAGVPWRDLFWIWQWGITDRALREAMDELGFSLEHYKNCGQWGDLPNFEDHAFLFVRR